MRKEDYDLACTLESPNIMRAIESADEIESLLDGYKNGSKTKEDLEAYGFKFSDSKEG